MGQKTKIGIFHYSLEKDRNGGKSFNKFQNGSVIRSASSTFDTKNLKDLKF